ncbi:hypothetical protein K1Y72_09005 [Actinomadura sp. PM05-2]|uniref:DUF3995 domain-containing protein n=1 Tax=Actinomadura parmotrematis TaxID=2864039 RepID=A0ABS7FQJ4_9ACTN|nr:hypothetical protein [Actinomadura parmotrematis]
MSPWRTVPGVPRWARWAAHGAALVNVPSGLWRIGLACGLAFGLADSELRALHAPGWGSLYLVGLSALAEVFGFLALGLVQPWGETWPRWVPLVRGRRVPVLAATVPAALGSLITTVYGVLFVYTNFHSQIDAAPWAKVLIQVLYAPVVLWGPLLAAVTVHYHRRRSAKAAGRAI